jgi:hypothetical protein
MRSVNFIAAAQVRPCWLPLLTCDTLDLRPAGGPCGASVKCLEPTRSRGFWPWPSGLRSALPVAFFECLGGFVHVPLSPPQHAINQRGQLPRRGEHRYVAPDPPCDSSGSMPPTPSRCGATKELPFVTQPPRAC